MLKKIQAIIIICRPVNIIITFLVIMTAAIISQNEFEISKTILLASLSGSFAAAGGYMINDILDLKTDIINRPLRILPSKKLGINTVLVFYLIFNLIAVTLTVFINFLSLIIMLFTIMILLLYSLLLKNNAIGGNLTIALLTGAAFIYGGAAVNNIGSTYIPAVLAFFVNLIREIIKDIEDIDGDRKTGRRTLPVLYGIEASVRAAVFLTLLLILLTIFPFAAEIYKIEYFILVMMSVNLLLVYFIKEILRDHSIENARKMSNLLKISMVFGLISIYIGN